MGKQDAAFYHETVMLKEAVAALEIKEGGVYVDATFGGGGHSREIIAQLSAEYNLPVWNFWAAVQPLPDHGLQDDGVHLTFGSNFFNDPEKLNRAWPVRNLTALQVLEAMRLSVQE